MAKSKLKIISKADAKRRGLKRFFTGKKCCHGHRCEQYVSNGRCVECKQRYDQSPEGRETQRRYNQSPKGHERQRRVDQS